MLGGEITPSLLGDREKESKSLSILPINSLERFLTFRFLGMIEKIFLNLCNYQYTQQKKCDKNTLTNCEKT